MDFFTIFEGKGKGKGYTAISASEGSWSIAKKKIFEGRREDLQDTKRVQKAYAESCTQII
jgi:hypothetical protein